MSLMRDVAPARDRLQSTPQRSQLRVQDIEHDSRFDHDMFGTDGDQLAEVAAQVDDQAGPQRTAPRV